MTATISVGLPAGYGQLVAEKDTAPALDLVVAARDAARAYADPLTQLRGVEAVAVLMGMSANTLKHKLDPDKGRWILGVNEALLLQRVTGSRGVLEAMAAALGCSVVQVIPDQADGDPAQAFFRFQQALGDFSASVAQALEEGRSSRNRQRRIQYLAHEVMATLGHLVVTVAALLPPEQGGKDAR